MTIVVARKYAQRVAILSDTMISDRSAKKHNVLPGRLKAVILSPTMSVAYCGLPDQAIDVIRAARKVLVEQGIDGAVECLRRATSEFGNQIDFLVVVHRPNAELRTIRAGSVSYQLDEAELGGANLLSFISRKAAAVGGISAPDIGATGAELSLISAFNQWLSMNAPDPVTGIGGLPIYLNASPFGHTYQSMAFSSGWGLVGPQIHAFDPGVAAQSGMTNWKFTIQASRFRGVSVLGVLFPQASLGWLYTPMREDEATKIRLLRLMGFVDPDRAMLAQFEPCLEAEARKTGGGIIVD
jgi:hypothetical protein